MRGAFWTRAHAMESVSQGGQAAHEHLPLPHQDQLLAGQEAAKRQQKRCEPWLQEPRHELKTGDPAQVLAERARWRSLMQQTGHRGALETLDKSLHASRPRPPMTRDASFRARGYPSGSGSVESANKLVVQSRMRTSGDALGTEPCEGHVGQA
jgi:hypothetical protein